MINSECVVNAQNFEDEKKKLNSRMNKNIRISDEIENKNDSIEFHRNYCYIKCILSMNKGLLFCGLDEQVCEKRVPKAF